MCWGDTLCEKCASVWTRRDDWPAESPTRIETFPLEPVQLKLAVAGGSLLEWNFFKNSPRMGWGMEVGSASDIFPRWTFPMILKTAERVLT